MGIKTLLMGLLLAASATSALAAGPYLGVAGGVTIAHDADVMDKRLLAKVPVEYDAGFGFNVTVGYDFQPARLEFEFGYKQNDLNKAYVAGVGRKVSNADITVMSYMVNALYDFKANSPLTPYAGVGIGLINGDSKTQGVKRDDTVFGYQIIIGANYNMNKNTALDLSYHFLSAPSDFSSDISNIEYSSSNIMVGMRYTF